MAPGAGGGAAGMARSHLPRARGASGPPWAPGSTTRSEGQWPRAQKLSVTLWERASHPQPFLFYPSEAQPRAVAPKNKCFWRAGSSSGTSPGWDGRLLRQLYLPTDCPSADGFSAALRTSGAESSCSMDYLTHTSPVDMAFIKQRCHLPGERKAG